MTPVWLNFSTQPYIAIPEGYAIHKDFESYAKRYGYEIQGDYAVIYVGTTRLRARLFSLGYCVFTRPTQKDIDDASRKHGYKNITLVNGRWVAIPWEESEQYLNLLKKPVEKSELPPNVCPQEWAKMARKNDSLLMYRPCEQFVWLFVDNRWLYRVDALPVIPVGATLERRKGLLHPMSPLKKLMTMLESAGNPQAPFPVEVKSRKFAKFVQGCTCTIYDGSILIFSDARGKKAACNIKETYK